MEFITLLSDRHMRSLDQIRWKPVILAALGGMDWISDFIAYAEVKKATRDLCQFKESGQPFDQCDLIDVKDTDHWPAKDCRRYVEGHVQSSLNHMLDFAITELMYDIAKAGMWYLRKDKTKPLHITCKALDSTFRFIVDAGQTFTEINLLVIMAHLAHHVECKRGEPVKYELRLSAVFAICISGTIVLAQFRILRKRWGRQTVGGSPLAVDGLDGQEKDVERAGGAIELAAGAM